MTDREKLIKELRWWADGCDRTNRGCQVRPLLERAADELENGVTVQRWIPVTERLPEKNTAVIAATDTGIVFQCLYAYDGWDLWEGNEVNITHWMPLPEPPKEGE